MGGGDKLNEMLKKFAGTMGKNMRVDTNALDRMTKQEANKERIRKKMEKRKATVEQKGTSEFVYRVPGEEEQQRSSAPMSDDQLIAEFEKDKKIPDKKKKKTKK